MALFFPMPGNEQLAEELAERTGGQVGNLLARRFPDGESYLRIDSDVAGQDSYLVCTLARPDRQFVPLALAAMTLRRLDAKSIGLVAPYLAYMRQDSIFRDGEALSAAYFAEMLEEHFDSMVTVDPHLHRFGSLDEIYRIRTVKVEMAPVFATWIRENVERPIVIGPDIESAQWVEEIARLASAPWSVLQKERLGDRRIRLKPPDLRPWRDHTPILIDDILSSGVTLRGAIRALRKQALEAPYCLIVHALGSRAVASHVRSNCTALLTSNSVPNAFAHFGVAEPIAERLIAAAAARPS
jgi:ribose-phosphate pyrophosphokinase